MPSFGLTLSSNRYHIISMKEKYSMEIPAGAKSQKIQDKVYVYIDRPFWNPDKRRGEHIRDYIGKIVNGQFSPNKKISASAAGGGKSGQARPGSDSGLQEAVLWSNVSPRLHWRKAWYYR